MARREVDVAGAWQLARRRLMLIMRCVLATWCRILWNYSIFLRLYSKSVRMRGVRRRSRPRRVSLYWGGKLKEKNRLLLYMCGWASVWLCAWRAFIQCVECDDAFHLLCALDALGWVHILIIHLIYTFVSWGFEMHVLMWLRYRCACAVYVLRWHLGRGEHRREWVNRWWWV